jgi:1,4-dihydroxy-2-naphthoate octaprenyltransferase
MLYGLAFILTVELPDRESDRLGGKMTWVAQKGRSFGFTLIAASFLFATLFFLFFPLLTSRNYPVDFHFLGILSLLPLGAGCLGLLKRPSEKPSATRVVNGIMIALVVFLILLDGYVVSLAFGRIL